MKHEANFNSYVYTLFLVHFCVFIGWWNLCKLHGTEKLLTNMFGHNVKQPSSWLDVNTTMTNEDVCLSTRSLNDDITWSIDVHWCMKPVGLKWFITASVNKTVSLKFLWTYRWRCVSKIQRRSRLGRERRTCIVHRLVAGSSTYHTPYLKQWRIDIIIQLSLCLFWPIWLAAEKVLHFE